MTVQTPLQDRFKQNIKDFTELICGIVEDVTEKGYETPINLSLVDVGKQFLLEKDSKILVEEFIRRSFDYWDDIFKKSDNLFKTKADSIFYGLPEEYIKSLSEILTHKHDGKNLIDDEDKESVWAFLGSLIKISIKFVHQGRCPVIDGNDQMKYTKKYFPKIKVKDLAKQWEIKKL